MVAGLLGKLVVPREDGDSVAADVMLGVTGAILGGYMVSTFAIAHSVSNYGLWLTVGAFSGALFLLLSIGWMTTQREPGEDERVTG